MKGGGLVSFDLRTLVIIETKDEFLALLLQARNELGGRVLGEKLNLDGSTVNNILRTKKASPMTIARASIPLAELSGLPRMEVAQKLCSLFLPWVLDEKEIARLDERSIWKRMPAKIQRGADLDAKRLFIHCSAGFCIYVNYTIQEEMNEETLVLKARKEGRGLQSASWYQMRLRKSGAAQRIGFTREEAKLMEEEFEKNNPEEDPGEN